MKRTVTIGPIRVFFTNRNREMDLPGHSHYAEVEVTWSHEGPVGWPSFKAYNDAVRAVIYAVLDHPIDGTNERVTEVIWQALDGRPLESERWTATDFTLDRVELAVMGVDDRIGHDPGMTRYNISR